MIPLNIDDPVVLRRTLEELEAKIPSADQPITPIDPLLLGSDLPTVVDKVNELITGFNAVVTQLELNSINALT